ncbi:hypothetical protein CJ030_MR2G004015 [Morella rubra]|uniref:RNase H type-1 domain-containing protein n=1 Tax=Morella rubra TaxID=262757 RepID=A0A6A1W9G1_9ROSI|nr:hypothetical protein CJ030_MR2G004015 [Morella rubra]
MVGGLSLKVFASSPIQCWLKFFLSFQNLPRKYQQFGNLVMLGIAITIDTIWTTRNKQVREGKSFEIFDLIRSVQRRYPAHQAAWVGKEMTCLICWQPPTEGMLKINFDVAVRENWLCAGVVCRNHHGEVLRVRTQKFRGRDPLKGEALAARIAFALAEEFVDTDILIEGDSLLLVEQVENLHLQADWMIEAEVSTMRSFLRTHLAGRFAGLLEIVINYLGHNIAQLAWNLVIHGDIDVDLIPQDFVNCDAPASYGRELS